MKQLQIKNWICLVSDEDFDAVSAIAWTPSPYPYNSSDPTTVYFKANLNGKTVLMHRLILGAARGQEVDHIRGTHTGSIADNTRANLRMADRSLNCRNRRNVQRNSKSGIAGVSFRSERGTWRALVYPQSKALWLGAFKTKSEAERAVENWKEENNYRGLAK